MNNLIAHFSLLKYAVLLIIERDRRSTFAFCDKICGQTGSENVQPVLQHCGKKSLKGMLRVLPPTFKPVLQVA